MKTDGYVKCNGKELADHAKIYIDVIGAENDRLFKEYQDELIRKNNEHHDSIRAVDTYVESQALVDIKLALNPYFINTTVNHGMLWWRHQTIERKIDFDMVLREHDLIKNVLIELYPNLWKYLPLFWYKSLQDHDFGRVINLARINRQSFYAHRVDFNWYKEPVGFLDISSLSSLVNLTDTDVFLSIDNYTQYVNAGKRYTELMQTTTSEST